MSSSFAFIVVSLRVYVIVSLEKPACDWRATQLLVHYFKLWPLPIINTLVEVLVLSLSRISSQDNCSGILGISERLEPCYALDVARFALFCESLLLSFRLLSP